MPVDAGRSSLAGSICLQQHAELHSHSANHSSPKLLEYVLCISRQLLLLSSTAEQRLLLVQTIVADGGRILSMPTLLGQQSE